MLELESGLTFSNTNFSIVLSHVEPARVIMAVPHDGLITNDFGGMFQTRSVGIKGRDRHIWPIVKDIAQQCAIREIKVDTVRFLMARAYIDANRKMPSGVNLDPETRGQTALDDLRLTSVYKQYHGELCRLVERSIARFGVKNVLFFDMHGFGRQPKIAPPEGYDLILGTANRLTIPYGEVDRRFAFFMEKRGYRVFLPQEKPVTPCGDPYSAGHTTRWYAHRYGINAIQIEIAPSFRRRECQAQGERLATDMADFLCTQYG